MIRENNFLPMTRRAASERGWKELDVILVTGDAYVDHPSYGASVIGRVLEAAGFKVGIIAQPDWKKPDDFLKLGRPLLFFGVTSGNLDSSLSNSTVNKKPRQKDYYSPGGRSGLRPNRAVIVYTNKIKELFPGVPVVLGGIEASLTRLAHYDYWTDTVRRSILLDAKADILVYGMGEKASVEIASGLAKGRAVSEIDGIRGTVVVRSKPEGFADAVTVPSFEEARDNKDKFNEAFRLAYLEADPFRGKTVAQKHGERFVVQFPPPFPLAPEELDRIYELPYARAWHPVYDPAGGIPGFEVVKFSVVSHRGCAAECNFCALYSHQGRIVQSRTADSVLREIRLLTHREDFRGTVTDIGGPTANLYASSCDAWSGAGTCPDRKCLMPEKCENLNLGYGETLALWDRVLEVPGVKRLYISSGLRYDLLVEKYADAYLRKLCERHIGGQLKVAPEHHSDPVLALMNKPPFKVYERFAEKFRQMNRETGKDQYLVHYFISSHPGSTLKDALDLSLYLAERRMHPEQVQDYVPLPMTVSSCMYHTGKDPFTGRPVYSAKKTEERQKQRALIQYRLPQNGPFILKSLKELNRTDLRALLCGSGHGRRGFRGGRQRFTKGGRGRFSQQRKKWGDEEFE